MADLGLLLEAERRGILPSDKAALLNEARRRGLVGGSQERDDPNAELNMVQQGLVGLGRSATKAGNALTNEALQAFANPQESFLGKLNPLIGIAGGAARLLGLGEERQALQQSLDERKRLQRQDTELFNRNAPIAAKVGEAAGDIAQFALPGGAVGRVNAASGLLTRAGAQALTGAATDAIQQSGEGAENLDLGRTVTAAALGAGGEVVGAGIARTVKAARQFVRGGGDALEAGRAIAQQFPGGDQLPDDVLRRLGERAGQLDAGASPESLLAEAEFGLSLTRGQKTGDFAQLSREEALRSNPNSPFGALIREGEANNRAAVQQGVDDLVTRLSGGQPPSSAAEAFGTLQPRIQSQAAQLKSQVNKAFDDFRQTPARVSAENTAGLSDRLRNSIDELDITADEAATNRILELVSEVDGKDVSMSDLARLRTRINSRIGAASNRLDTKAAVTVKRELDSFFEDLTDKALISGDASAIEQLKSANALRRQFGQRFESRGGGDRAGKLIEQMVRGDATAEQVANTALGASQVSKVAGGNFVQAIKRALGDDVDALGQVKAAVILNATSKKTGETAGPQQIVNNLRSLFNTRPALMEELFTGQERATLQRFTQALDPLVRKGDFARTSGTAERLIRTQAVQSIPWLGNLLTQALDARAAARAVRPVSAAAAAPGFSGAVAGASSSIADEI